MLEFEEAQLLPSFPPSPSPPSFSPSPSPTDRKQQIENNRYRPQIETTDTDPINPRQLEPRVAPRSPCRYRQLDPQVVPRSPYRYSPYPRQLAPQVAPRSPYRYSPYPRQLELQLVGIARSKVMFFSDFYPPPCLQAPLECTDVENQPSGGNVNLFKGTSPSQYSHILAYTRKHPHTLFRLLF